MARPESEPKTPLGHRLRAIRRHFGDEERDAFALRLGLSKSAVARYERGENPPDADALAAYHVRLGINVHWLISGKGSMLDDPAKALPPAYNPAVFEKLAGLADRVHQQFDIKLPRLALASQAGYLFDELLKRVSDVNDPDEVEAALPLLEFMLKKQLQAAAESPGAGKRGAS